MKNQTPAEFAGELERRKGESTLQLLFKCARLLNDEAIARVRQRTGAPVRSSHTQLLPHIDLAGTRLTVLAQRLGVTKQATGQLVAELCELGMLELAPDPSDGRAKLVRFSARGKKGLLQGLGVLRELEAELAAEVGAARMKALHETLSRLLAARVQPDEL